MKRFILISIILISVVKINGQGYRINCLQYLKYGEYENALDCFTKQISRNIRLKYDSRTNWYLGQTYSAIFSSEDTTINNIDINAFENSINSFYQALILNLKDTSYRSLDFNVIDEREFIIATLTYPEANWIENELTRDIIEVRLPIIEDYLNNHQISDESLEILVILRKIPVP